jgi:broad specificity phosphatase PhoE
MTIVLCRHGTTDANAPGEFLSRRDPSLNARGRELIARARATLGTIAFDCGFSSPMRRCIETIEIVAPNTPYVRDDALREVHFGLWEGRTLECLEINDPAAVALRRRDPVNFRPAGGESFLDASHRLRPFADSVRKITNKNVVIVGHRGSLGVLERLLRGLPLESQLVTPLEPGEFHILELAT